DDADLEAAVATALFGLYMNTGQVCSAGTRILVQEGLYDRFVERFVERSQQVKVGDPMDFATRMGPLVSEEQLRKVQRYVEIGKKEGARLRCGGGQPKDLKRAHRLAKRLQAGTVWINTWHMIEPNSPFGGYKLSGYGRENGMAMVEHLTRLKQVWVDLNDFTMDLFA